MKEKYILIKVLPEDDEMNIFRIQVVTKGLTTLEVFGSIEFAREELMSKVNALHPKDENENEN